MILPTTSKKNSQPQEKKKHKKAEKSQNTWMSVILALESAGEYGVFLLFSVNVHVFSDLSNLLLGIISPYPVTVSFSFDLIIPAAGGDLSDAVKPP